MARTGVQRRLMAAFLALLACVVVPAAILLDRQVGDDVVDLLREGLTRDARLLADELAEEQPESPQAWVLTRAARLSARVTLIDASGRVTADSEVPVEALSTLENHAQRPEVAQALSGQVGFAVRRSTTLGRDLMYVAAPVTVTPPQVVRLALGLDQVGETVGGAHSVVWLSGLLALALAVALGAIGARWLSRPVQAMTRAARSMSRGEFSVVLPPAGEDELGELVHALEALRSQLAARIEELHQEGDKLRLILDGMSEGVALVQDGTLAVTNPAFQRLLGVRGAVEGLTPLEATRLPDLAGVIERAISERKPAQREVQVNGRALVLQASSLSQPRQAVVVVFDLTETKKLEKLRRDFVANASHELRTPVAAIVGAAETLAAGAADEPEARASFLDILMRHAHRLARLTADLLDIARLEGGYKPRVETVDVNAAVDGVLSALKGRADEKSVTLARDVPEGATLAAERAAVDQILTNLVDNAVKYTPPKGTVTVRAQPRGTTLQLTVEDTGPGIPAEHVPRLFERFYRVDDARSRELGGTGLGLAIVKHLALANRGAVRVESEVGRGSRFIVSLPRM